MIQPIPKMTFEAALGLSEAEVRLLNHLAGYGSGLTKAIQEHVTKAFNPDLMDDFLGRLRDETASCIRKFDAARAAFKEKEQW